MQYCLHLKTAEHPSSIHIFISGRKMVNGFCFFFSCYTAFFIFFVIGNNLHLCIIFNLVVLVRAFCHLWFSSLLRSDFFFSFIFISWRLVTLQHCSGFCHTLTWISHGFTCVPHPNPPSRLPLTSVIFMIFRFYFIPFFKMIFSHQKADWVWFSHWISSPLPLLIAFWAIYSPHFDMNCVKFLSLLRKHVSVGSWLPLTFNSFQHHPYLHKQVSE